MALVVGSRLGHYDVTALIGEGGMGEVWQATDTKLNRQVALRSCLRRLRLIRIGWRGVTMASPFHSFPRRCRHDALTT